MNETTRLICGRPFSLQNEIRFWSLVHEEPMSGCWLWGGSADPAGYGHVSVGPRGASRNLLVHRISWELRFGPIPDGLLVRHFACDNPPCCNPSHLRVGTQADNIADRDAKGRQARGKRSGVHTHPETRQVGTGHWKCILTEEDVREIRKMRAQSIPCAQISAKFGVKEAQVSAIATRRSWRHIA